MARELTVLKMGTKDPSFLVEDFDKILFTLS
jgi:hypothetical protein